MIQRAYIGDGVYAGYDGYHIVLSTDRDGKSETIYLDNEVYRNLVAYHDRLAVLLKSREVAT